MIRRRERRHSKAISSAIATRCIRATFARRSTSTARRSRQFRVNLDLACKVFGVTTSSAGRRRPQRRIVTSGLHREIADYCLEDVRATLELYEKIAPTLLMFNKDFRESEEREMRPKKEEPAVISTSEQQFVQAVTQTSLELTASLDMGDAAPVGGSHQAMVFEKLVAPEEPEEEIPIQSPSGCSGRGFSRRLTIPFAASRRSPTPFTTTVPGGRWDTSRASVPGEQPNGEVVDSVAARSSRPDSSTHLHAPQLEMIGSYGGHLLEWLNRYTFPTEAKFSDPKHAATIAKAFFDELLHNGTLCALIFSTIHFEATDIFFAEAERRGFRGIIGKAMMDRNAPDALLETAQDSYDQSRELLKKWHNRGLLRYAITPRFAPTSTPELLERAGDLKREFPGAYVHTHISENTNEVTWVHAFSGGGVRRRLRPLWSARRANGARAWCISPKRSWIHRAARLAHRARSNSNLFRQRPLPAPSHATPSSSGSARISARARRRCSPRWQMIQSSTGAGVSLSPSSSGTATLGGARALSLDGESGSLEVVSRPIFSC
jgi:hypothetical protein